MAIVLQEQQETNWKALIWIALVLIIVGFGGYFLFWAQAPAIEKVIPNELKSAAELSNVKFRTDLDSVVRELPPQGKLQIYVGKPGVGQTGRSNPFLKF